MRITICIIALLLLGVLANAQEIVINLDLEKAAAKTAVAFLNNTDQSFEADANGTIKIQPEVHGKHLITLFIEGYQSRTEEVHTNQPPYTFEMTPLGEILQAVEIEDTKKSGTGHGYLRYIEVDGIYAAKKNEVIVPSDMAVNQASNNGRQLFAKVPGVNVQETDAGGLQMGVGARGLDPKRTTNFNTRQDGYDIAADALGYPESYYTAPIEAVKQIELVRGAASLQYGTQFGGLLNFKMKRGAENTPLELVSRQTIGSYDFFNCL